MQEERKADITKVRKIFGGSLLDLLVLLYMIWSRI
jgi:hypothetical protein